MAIGDGGVANLHKVVDGKGRELLVRKVTDGLEVGQLVLLLVPALVLQQLLQLAFEFLEGTYRRRLGRVGRAQLCGVCGGHVACKRVVVAEVVERVAIRELRVGDGGKDDVGEGVYWKESSREAGIFSSSPPYLLLLPVWGGGGGVM